MEKVYVATFNTENAGGYSMTRVFSTEEKAQEWVEQLILDAYNEEYGEDHESLESIEEEIDCGWDTNDFDEGWVYRFYNDELYGVVGKYWETTID